MCRQRTLEGYAKRELAQDKKTAGNSDTTTRVALSEVLSLGCIPARDIALSNIGKTFEVIP